MKFKLKINQSESEKAGYVGWTPTKCTLKIVGYTGTEPVPVTISTGQIPRAKGKIALYKDNSTSASSIKTIQRDFKGEEFEFYVAGVFDYASVAKQDTFIKVESDSGAIDEIERKVMVRVRKNANELEVVEKKKFLEAFIRLNSLPSKRTYTGNEFVKKPNSILHELVLMHTYDAASEIHGRTSFHPWHRAFLLHLEREMQEIDPTVTIPYWKCDQKADKVFTLDFMGETRKTEMDDKDPDFNRRHEKLCPKFNLDNPMSGYKDHTLWGPLRRAYYKKNPAEHGLPVDEFMNMVGDYELVDSPKAPDDFMRWSRFEERQSHNPGHVTFTGHVVDVGKDPVDPLFFLLHSNVDRLWARWQRKYGRFNSQDEKTYPFQGSYKDRAGGNSRGARWATSKKMNDEGYFDPNDLDVGNWVEDTLWPWDQDHILSRPMREWNATTIVGSYDVKDVGVTEGEKHKVPQIDIEFPSSLSSTYPEGPITVGSTIDYQGRLNHFNAMGFDYDKVPYFDKDEMPSFPPPKSSEIKKISNLKSLPDINSAEFLDAALNRLSDHNESTDGKSDLIHHVFASKRFNKFFPSRKPRFFNILRGMLQSETPQHRFQAIDILSSHDDQEVQSMMVNRVKKDSALDDSRISKSDALFFLRQSTKQQHTTLFREIVEKKTDSDEDLRAAAIEGLASDPESKDIVEKVLLDNNESFKVRTACALAMNFSDSPKAFQLAEQMTIAEKSSEGIQVFQNDSPDPDEVDFTATLFNILTYTGDPEQLKGNEELKSSLRDLVSPDNLNKANLISTIETSGDTPVDGPTIIEQMASELLSRLEDNSND